MGRGYGNFTLKLALGKKSLAFRGLIFEGEDISVLKLGPFENPIFILFKRFKFLKYYVTKIRDPKIPNF